MKKSKMRMIWNSNAPWAFSGYAQQMQDLAPKLHKKYPEMAISAFYGLEGGIIEWNGIKCYPKMGDTWGIDALVNHSKKRKDDYQFTLQDIWTLDEEGLKKLKRWIPILPVDHDPLPPPVEQRLKYAYRIVTYSKFGHEKLLEKGYFSTYIPHTVDTKIFKKRDKEKSRKKFNIPKDAFVFGMVAANKDFPPRKSFQEAIDAFKEFLKVEPNSYFYMHVNTSNSGGFPITQYAKFLGIEDRFLFSPIYEQLYGTSKTDMSYLMSAFDCLLLPSVSEGFGIPTIEAQACETPVIVNDFTALSELVDKGGLKTKVLTKRFSQNLSYVGIPDTKDLCDKMVTIHKSDRVQMGRDGRKFVTENYDLDKVVNEMWFPFLKKLEGELDNPIM